MKIVPANADRESRAQFERYSGKWTKMLLEGYHRGIGLSGCDSSPRGAYEKQSAATHRGLLRGFLLLIGDGCGEKSEA